MCRSRNCPSRSCPSRSCPSRSCPSRSCPSQSCPSQSCPSQSYPIQSCSPSRSYPIQGCSPSPSRQNPKYRYSYCPRRLRLTGPTPPKHSKRRSTPPRRCSACHRHRPHRRRPTAAHRR
ncbi:Cys-every-fifth RiPP peptide CefA [Paraburkholderia oxyphila]|uniref:Cys-every-fifth RiPP peptide CefA n=1 Tax=Paraburkholderia oxyphila TaxID=614212 RepID=UPI00159BFB14